MRKFILLALAIGAVELVRREADKRGITTSALLSNFITGTVARATGEEPDAPANS